MAHVKMLKLGWVPIQFFNNVIITDLLSYYAICEKEVLIMKYMPSCCNL